MNRGDLVVPSVCQTEFPAAAAAFAKLGVPPEALAQYCRDAEEDNRRQSIRPAASA